MECECGRRDIEPGLDVADRQAVRPCFDEEAEDVEARAIAKLGKYSGSGASFHGVDIGKAFKESNHKIGYMVLYDSRAVCSLRE